MKRFDLELLLIFDEIYKTGNVTRAADNLGLPQSTVSLGLGKLRGHFNDQLFTRTARGMVPTPRAQNAIEDVRRSLQALQHALADQPVFDPAASKREFRICMTDISEIVLLPRLLNHLRETGPGIHLEISKISPDSPADLASGAVDLAVGFMPHLEAGFYQQKLFDQHFVCLVANRHPRVGDTLSLEALRSERHLDDVRADQAQAQAYGINGVPFFVIDGQYGVSGAQPPEAFAGVLRELWAKRGQDAEVLEG